MQEKPISIGLVGAGPWAEMVYGPTLAASTDVQFVGIWARRPEAADALAAGFGTNGFGDYDALLERCDAVAFAVPPNVQTVMAARAATKGKAVLLEKPLGMRLDDAQALASTIGNNGVISQLMLTWRYTETVRNFISRVQSVTPLGARAHFINASSMHGPFATPWRREQGALVDLGPHVFDTLDAALGKIVSIRAHGELLRWVGVLLEHESGVCSEVSLCGHSMVKPQQSGAQVYTREGVHEISQVDGESAIAEGAFARALTEFANAVRTNTAHPLDAQRGLHLAQLVETARQQIDR
jgi:predicted dehydrogenase